MLIDTGHIDLSESTENSGSLVCPAVSLSLAAFENLKTADLFLRSMQLGEIWLADELGTEIALTGQAALPKQTKTGRFSIQKQASFPIYFTEKALVEHLEELTMVGPLYGLLFTEKGFRTERTVFLGKNEINLEISNYPATEASVDEDVPNLVKALNTEAISYLPSASACWLGKEQPDLPDWWKKLATAKLLCAFCKELRISGHVGELTFLSDRRVIVNIPLRADKLAESYAGVQATTRWLYQDNKGADTRHSLINNQVGLLPVSDTELMTTNLKPVIEKVLAGAEMAYRYYLQDTNKELYKSLTEINKNLFEHTGKIRQNTMDLIGGLWRDFTTAFGLLVLDFSLKKPDISASYWNWLLYGLIVYLIVNLALTSNMGFWFYYKVKASLADMRTRIYGYLTVEDYNVYAFDPLKTAFRKFRATFFWIALCYLAIISLVLLSIYLAPKIATPVKAKG